MASGALAGLSGPPQAALDSVTLGARDPSVLIGFYDAALAPLGVGRVVELVDEEEDDAPVEAVGFGADDGHAFLWVVTADVATSGVHLRLRADRPAEVEAFHAAAVGHGGRSHAAPRRWTVYRRGEYGAAVADPSGNVVEVVAPE